MRGYDTFIAHDDIPGSEVWEKEILHAIRNADFFIPLVSENFKNSSYTDQETGCAVCLNKKVIAIKLDTTNPYGFINKYQALQYRKEPTDNLFEVAITIAHIGLHYQPKTVYYKKSLQSLVHALCNSSSFETTNTIIRIVSKCNHQFSKDQVTQIVKAMQSNLQIIGAFGLPELKRILITTYRCRID
ncbi:toll/interleukin-1 receptor domain-containing protein [Candidatus Gottesmanbacteria bacterium]|nr:toll/interleukin-1 receptor domain-containing protein [Candidatus Gottesmanbacteria bacterium]